MTGLQIREVAVVVGVATVGVLTVAVIVLGPVVGGDEPRYPHVTELHPPPQPQP